MKKILNFKMALCNGAQLQEIFEAIFQVAAYAGFAAAWDALEKLAEVLNEDAAYTINAVAGPGGSISPEGSVTKIGGSNLTITITPDSGYSVQEILVDGISIGIALDYTFTKIDRNHSIQVNFAPNNSPPIADAGTNQTLEVGDTITLDASQSSDPNDRVVFYEWFQTSGPTTTLSDENGVKPTFVAAPAMVNSSLTFQLTVYDSGGSSNSDSVQISVIDNGITGFAPDVITFYFSSNKPMGIKVESGGALTSLRPMDPASDSISDKSGMPQNMVYGLIDFMVRVDNAGAAAGVTIFLPEPMPDGYHWYKYSIYEGWYDYSDNITLNAARDRVTLTLVDGGIGDDDNDQNGTIIDPSGLGNLPSPPAATSSGSGGGGCFIDSVAYGSLTMPGVALAIISILVSGLSTRVKSTFDSYDAFEEVKRSRGRNAGYPAPLAQIPSMPNYRTGFLPQV